MNKLSQETTAALQAKANASGKEFVEKIIEEKAECVPSLLAAILGELYMVREMLRMALEEPEQ